MPLPQAPKRGKDPRRPQHFGYLRGYRGEDLYGFLAGPMMWFDLHTSDLGSKPCLEVMTKGELSCSLCKHGAPVCKGACGFYHANDGKPYLLWLDESKRDEYETWRWLSKIKFGREGVKGAPVWAALCLSQEPRYSSTLPERKRPADLTGSLLRMWKLPELDLWYRVTHGVSDNGLSLAPEGNPVPAPKGKGKPPDMYTAAHRLVDEEIAGANGIDAATEAIKARAGGRAAPPSANGKHGKTEGGAS